MNLNFGSMLTVLGSSIRTLTPVLAVLARRSQHMHIKYMFIISNTFYHYGVMPVVAA
jgi:hypothetical protein